MTASPARTATVVITTKNRRDELRNAVRSALTQADLKEVLVIDDGSTDGTADLIRSEFSGVRLIRHDQSRGYIVCRNEAAREATGDIVISIDDDAVFTAPGMISRVVAAFDRDDIGAVAIPYSDVNQGPAVYQCAPETTTPFVTNTFKGTAHALRRDVFLKVGSYREYLFHQGEESDFCIRMLAAGYVVRLGTGEPLHHFESPKRSFSRMDYFGPRNAILFVWQNVPFPILLIHLPATVGKLMMLTFNPSRFLTRLRGVIGGLGACLRFPRVPVSSHVYAAWRRLQRSRPPLTLDAAERELGLRTS